MPRAQCQNGKWYADYRLCVDMLDLYIALRQRAVYAESNPQLARYEYANGTRITFCPDQRKLSSREHYAYNRWVEDWIATCMSYRDGHKCLPEGLVPSHWRGLHGATWRTRSTAL